MADTKPISWDQFAKDCLKLVPKIERLGKFHSLVCVTRGGLVPGAIIAQQMGLKKIDTICVMSYEKRAQAAPKIIKSAGGLSRLGPGVLIIDDLVDTGITAELVKKEMPGCIYAVVYAKPAGKAQADVYAVAVEQTDWLIFPWEAD